jgi:MSHA biogenesis protein MshP
VSRRGPAQPRGFALLAALFLMIVIATLGTFAMRLNVSQQTSTDLELAGVKADAALQSGIEYAAARVLAVGCGGVPDAPLAMPENFSVRLDNCQPVANIPTGTVFSVTAIAFRGQYGSPDFVHRERTVRITP